jgi:hypothetical protein
VVNLANVDAVFQEIGEGPVGERDATVVFGDLGVPALGDDAAAVQLGDKLAGGFQLEVKTEDGADGFSFGLVNDKLLVFGLVAQRNGAAGPFAFTPAGRNLVPDSLG